MAMTSKQRDQRNINPHKAAVAAMWLHGNAYAAQNGGSMDFWDKLTETQQRHCRDFVEQIEKARAE